MGAIPVKDGPDTDVMYRAKVKAPPVPPMVVEEGTKLYRRVLTGMNSQYGPMTLRDACDYLDGCRDAYKMWMKGVVEREVKMPTMEGLALHLGVTTRTLEIWVKKHEQFAMVVDALKLMQKERLVSGGLSGTYNPAVTKLMLINNHGMSDKVEVEQVARRILIGPAEDEDEEGDDFVKPALTDRKNGE